MSDPAFPTDFEDVPKLQELLKQKPESYWVERGELMSLNLFHEMARRVPAYKTFLEQHGFDPQSVKSIADLKTIPTVSKDNYLRRFPRNELCWDGNFANNRWVISTTSGSTGEPFYFPRTDLQDKFYATTAELYMRENFQIQDKSTLYIDAFAMGAWIGGLFTYEAVKQVAEKGYNLSIITPGINKQEVINSVRNLGADFDQVIIGCYPPIMKDIIDLGNEIGLDWSDYNLGIVFSAEGFSEEFRDYFIKYAKLPNAYTSTLNHYGTVDLGTMSHETPVSILARRQAVNDKQLFQAIFKGTVKQPTFTQFIPELFYFEEEDGGVICSSPGGIPLVRYDLKDNGGVISLESLRRAYKGQGKDLESELKENEISDTLWNLPFVYLYERSDFSVTFSGAQIYPEEIRRSLTEEYFEDKLTGKSTMIAGYDKQASNFLEINVELRQGVDTSEALVERIKQAIIDRLVRENSEYRVLYGEGSTKLHPIIKLWPYGDPLHFGGRGKHKWVKK